MSQHKQYGKHTPQPARTEHAQGINKPMTIQYGHNGTHVVMMYSVRLQNVTLTEEQVDDLIRNLQGCKEALAKHRAEHGN